MSCLLDDDSGLSRAMGSFFAHAQKWSDVHTAWTRRGSRQMLGSPRDQVQPQDEGWPNSWPQDCSEGRKAEGLGLPFSVTDPRKYLISHVLERAGDDSARKSCGSGHGIVDPDTRGGSLLQGVTPSTFGTRSDHGVQLANS